MRMKIDSMRVVLMGMIISLCMTSCDKETDDLIAGPTETSTTLSGYIKTPDGTPLSDIPVGVDFRITGLFGSTVIHKAKGTTDKAGFYRIFFEADEEMGQGITSGYYFSVDFSRLSSDKYIPAEKLDFGLPYFADQWTGNTYNCDFRIPLKKMVKVKIVNDGRDVVRGKYAVKIMFPYCSYEDFFQDQQNFWDTEGYWRIFEDVEIPGNGSITVTVPMAIGVENTISIVSLGDETVTYPNGITFGDSKALKITEKFDDVIELKYCPPAHDDM